jgi:hypothetical protein
LFQPFDGYPKGAPTLGPMTDGDNSLIYGFDSLTYNTMPGMEPVLSPTNMAPVPNGPNCYFDLMSYCRKGGLEDVWPSSVTYTALLSSINATFPPPTPAPKGGPRPKGGGAGGDFLIARGTVDFNAGTAQFLPCLPLSTTTPPPAPPPGTNFFLQALDASGAVLQAIPFALEPDIVEENDTNRTAAFIVPVTADPALHTLQLGYNGVLLATLTASPNAPTVTLTTPNGGQNFATGAVNVAWSGNDADGDPLTYTVQYSTDDGANWETLAVDWPGQNLGIDSAALAATKNGLMRVLASDGFNTATAQSVAPFTVQPHAPTLSIISPLDGATFIGDVQVFLDASANDMQDGPLDGTNVQWSSNLDGPLGHGAIVTFNASTLSEGYHTITVTATDSAGLTNSAVTHLRDLRAPPPQLTIQMSPGSSNATLSWPAQYTNYVLQASASLAAGWATITNTPPKLIGNQQTVSVGPSGLKSFFRLKAQP